MNNWKIPAGFAAFGAVLSLLAGIIGGNPFGVILLRLAVSAVVAAALGLGITLAVKKFLPELGTAAPAVAAQSGDEVDIVIDEDILLERPAEEQPDREPTGQQPDREAEEAAEPMEPVEALAEDSEQMPMEPDSLDSFEPEEMQPEQRQVRAMEDRAAEDENQEEDILTLESADSEEDESTDLQPSAFPPPSGDFENLDTLPDMEHFAPAAEEAPSTPKPSRMNAEVEKVVRDQDPENLARAVRTFMKKDQ